MTDRCTGRSLYRSLLGESFDRLHPHLLAAHTAPLSVQGVAEVRKADGLIGRVVARVMNFPAPGQGVPVRLEVRDVEGGTEWVRLFAGRRVRTVQSVVDGCMVERRGPGRLFFRVSVVDGAVVYESVRFSVFGLVVPQSLTPRAKGRVTATDDGWQVEIEVRAPVAGLLTAYRARLCLDCVADEAAPFPSEMQ